MKKSLLLSEEGNEAVERHYCDWPMFQVIRRVTNELNMQQPQATLACGQVFALTYEVIDSVLCTSEDEAAEERRLREFCASELHALMQPPLPTPDHPNPDSAIGIAMLAAARFLTTADRTTYFQCSIALMQAAFKLVGETEGKRIHDLLQKAFRTISEDTFKEHAETYINTEELKLVRDIIPELTGRATTSSTEAPAPTSTFCITSRNKTNVYLLLTAMYLNGYVNPQNSRNEFINHVMRQVFGTTAQGIDQTIHAFTKRKTSAREIAHELLENVEEDLVKTIEDLMSRNK